MQLSCSTSRGALAGASSSMRLAPRLAAAGKSRARSVQVEAKGKSRFRQQQQGAPMPGGGMQQQTVPDMDPDNEEFAIFVRINNPGPGVPTGWAGPITVVKGGQAANLLVKGMQSPWGKALYSKTLITNIAQAIYQDKETAIKAMRKSAVFQNVPAKDFVFGFKIRSKLDEKDVLKPVNITELPDASLLGGNAIDAFRKFWSPDNLATMFSK